MPSRITIVFLAAILLSASLPEILNAVEPATKAALPNEDAIAAASKAVSDVYKNRTEAAKTPEVKSKLAAQLLQDGIDTRDDTAARFVIYRAARKVAAGAGDGELALRIMDQMTADFQIDAASLQRETLAELAPQAKTAEDSYVLVRLSRRLSRAAAAADQYDSAIALAQSSLEIARKVRDADILKQRERELKRVLDAAEQYKIVQPFLATLETAPTDAGANTAAGKYYCFVIGNLAKGIPMLALGDDAGLKALAASDLRNPPDAPSQIALGDAWYEAAKQQPAALQRNMLQRAGYWYRVSPLGASGLAKVRIDKRLAEIDIASSPFPVNEWVEVLDYVELPRDGRKGRYEWRNMSLFLPRREKNAEVVLPVGIGGNFEVRVRAVQAKGTDILAFSLPLPGHHAMASLNTGEGKAHCGIWNVNGLGGENPSNPSRGPAINVVPGQPYTVEWKLERDKDNVSLRASVNGRRAIAWSGPISSLNTEESAWSAGRVGERMLVGNWGEPLTIYSIRLRMTSGSAWLAE